MPNRNHSKSAWLLNAEVQTKVEEVCGRWEVYLIFINTLNPKEFLVVPMGDYRTEKLANIYALYMQKTASKDFRGTKKIDKDAYNFNRN